MTVYEYLTVIRFLDNKYLNHIKSFVLKTEKFMVSGYWDNNSKIIMPAEFEYLKDYFVVSEKENYTAIDSICILLKISPYIRCAKSVRIPYEILHTLRIIGEDPLPLPYEVKNETQRNNTFSSNNKL